MASTWGHLSPFLAKREQTSGPGLGRARLSGKNSMMLTFTFLSKSSLSRPNSHAVKFTLFGV